MLMFDFTAVSFILWGCFFHFIGVCLTSGGFGQILLPSEVKGGLGWVCVRCGRVDRCVIFANVWRTAEISRSHTWRRSTDAGSCDLPRGRGDGRCRPPSLISSPVPWTCLEPWVLLTTLVSARLRVWVCVPFHFPLNPIDSLYTFIHF